MAAGNGGCCRPAAPSADAAADRRERGVALVIVVWTLALLAVLAGQFSGASRTHANLAFNVVERAKAEALADAAVSRAIAGLMITPEEGGLRVDQTPYAWVFGDGEAVFTIDDEGGKFDLNVAEPEALAELFTGLGLPPRESAALAAAVADFRDEDDETTPDGGEAEDYRRAGLPTGPKNAPFERVDELVRVLGMSAELFARVRPVVTVYTGLGAPEVDLMPPDYQLLLGDALRRRADGGGGDRARLAPSPRRTERGRPQFEGAVRRQQAPQTDTNALVSLQAEGTDARSEANVFTIHAEARSSGGGVFVREAVVLMEPDSLPPYSFLDIREGAREFFVDR